MKTNIPGVIALSLASILIPAKLLAQAENASSGTVLLAEGARLASSAPEMESGRALAMAAADFDEDGVPDLIASHAGAEGGLVTLRRGNVDAIYPNSPEAKARKQNGQFTEAAFLAEVRSFTLPEAADFLGAGDFDGDGHWDIVAARTGSEKLLWLRGDGHGNFAAAQAVEVPGAVTALVTGEMNRADGLTDVAVGIITPASAQALVFESPNGALRGKPEIYPLPAPVTDFAFGQLDDEGALDLAIASGQEVIVVHGRDRKLSLDAERHAEVRPAKVTRCEFKTAVLSVALGDFAGDPRPELAVLTADGKVRTLTREGSISATALQAPGSPACLRATKTSAGPRDDLLVFGRARRVEIAAWGGERMERIATLEIESGVAAVLPMRLNRDALQDLIVLPRDGRPPRVFLTQPSATYIVNAEGNTSDIAPGDGVCADASGNCTFGAALQEANAHAGADTIEFNIPGAGIHTLQNGNNVEDTVTIDGTTQPQGNIEIAGNGVFPLAFFTNNSVLRGVAAYGSSFAILLLGNGNIVEGNHIGFRADGTVPVGYGNFGSGLSFRGGVNQSLSGSNNLIGGTTVQARNVISNCSSAFEMFGAGLGNIIRGNYIGTTPDGAAALPNRNTVIRVDSNTDLTLGGTTAGAGNLISGNTASITVSLGTVAAIIQGNLIGTNAAGNQPLANSGVAIEVADNRPVTIGGTTAAARNVIAANALGIRIGHDSGGGTVIQGNYIGTNAAGTGALPNLGIGLQLSGTRAVTVGGVASGAGNLVSGNGGDGIELWAGVNGTPARGVLIQGNFVGTDMNGALALAEPGRRDRVGRREQLRGRRDERGSAQHHLGQPRCTACA